MVFPFEMVEAKLHLQLSAQFAFGIPTIATAFSVHTQLEVCEFQPHLAILSFTGSFLILLSN